MVKSPIVTFLVNFDIIAQNMAVEWENAGQASGQMEAGGFLETCGEPVRLTRRMVKARQRIALDGETLGDALGRLYEDGGKSFRQIAPSAGISVSRLGVWFKKLRPDILVRNLSDPVVREYFLDHPEKKEQLLQGYKDYYARRKAARVEGWFGDNPKAVLGGLVNDGLKAGEIAARYDGLTVYTLRGLVREFGLKLKRGRRIEKDAITSRREMVKGAIENGLFAFLTPRQQEVLGALYAGDGPMLTAQEVGQRLRVSRQNIDLVCKWGLARIERLAKGDKATISLAMREEIDEIVLDLYYKGVETAEIAAFLGRSSKNVNWRLRRMGIERKPGRRKVSPHKN